MIDQRRNVLAPIRERRHDDAVSATAMEQRVEPAAGRVARQVARRRGDHAARPARALVATHARARFARGCPRARAGARTAARERRRETACRPPPAPACWPGDASPGSTPARRVDAVEPLGVCSSGQLTKMNAPRAPEAACTACATASLPAPGRTGEEQRLGARRLPRDRVPQRAHRGALAEQRTVDAAARIAQELLGDAQLALERRRSLRHPRLERRVRRLQRVGGARAAPRRAARCGSRSQSGWRRSRPARDRAR